MIYTPICLPCWRQDHSMDLTPAPGSLRYREPVKVGEVECVCDTGWPVEACYFCKRDTNHGLYLVSP